jgi:hypothetical protein
VQATAVIETNQFISTVNMEAIEPRAIDWLWKPYIPRGMVTFVEGDPGTGKSLLTIAMATALSRGERIFNDPRPATGKPECTLFYANEDPLPESMKPRLIAAGADASRIYVAGGVPPFSDDAGMDYLRRSLEHLKPALVVVDPIQAHLGAGVDINRANQVRPILDHISRMASKYRIAVVFVRHFTKAENGKAINRGLGSIDFAAAARSMLQVGMLDHLECGIVHVKTNVGPKGKSIRYQIQQVPVDGIPDPVGKFVYLGEGDFTDAAFRQDSPGPMSSLDDARIFLLEALSGRDRPASEMTAEAQRAGISERTLDRAKRELNVRSQRTQVEGKGVWMWTLG